MHGQLWKLGYKILPEQGRIPAARWALLQLCINSAFASVPLTTRKSGTTENYVCLTSMMIMHSDHLAFSHRRSASRSAFENNNANRWHVPQLKYRQERTRERRVILVAGAGRWTRARTCAVYLIIRCFGRLIPDQGLPSDKQGWKLKSNLLFC